MSEIRIDELPKVTLPIGPKGGLRRMTIHEALEMLLRRVAELEGKQARSDWI